MHRRLIPQIVTTIRGYSRDDFAADLGRSELLDEIGDDQTFGNVDDALNRARRELGLSEESRPLAATATVARERILTPPAGVPAIGQWTKDE